MKNKKEGVLLFEKLFVTERVKKYGNVLNAFVNSIGFDSVKMFLINYVKEDSKLKGRVFELFTGIVGLIDERTLEFLVSNVCTNIERISSTTGVFNLLG